MTLAEFNITIHMVSSLDGMIAKTDNSVEWFESSSPYEKGVVGQDPEEFLKTIDCYVMGSHTYEHAMELSKSYGWAYGNKPTFVLTTRSLPSERQNIEFYSGDLKQFVEDRLKLNYKNAWVVGGASLARDFIHLKLADEIRLSILPIILGDGIRLFDDKVHDQFLHLNEITAYKNGMVELWYLIKK